MQTTFKLSIAFVLASGTLLAQSPAPAAVLNPASNILAGLPNSGIAQGSIFVVYGTNLGPTTLAQASSIPLPTTEGVGGTSVKITVGQTTVDAPMIYSVASQIAGVVPSSVPVGSGTLTVTFNGKTGSTPIQVVASNFGISTVNQTGGGPAVVTFPDYSVITTINPAKPGDTGVLWGTGLGPITGSDAGIPATADLGTPIKVYLGGVSAAVTYRGRSAAPGLDQINFVVPPGISGCYVSLSVQTGDNLISNTTSMSISPDGGPCSDANGIQLSSLPGALSKGRVNVGSVTLNNVSFTISEFGQTISNSTTLGAAAFERFTKAQLATSPTLSGLPSVGSCTVSQFTGTTTPSITSALALGLDAGSAIAVTPPSGSVVNLTQSQGVKGSYSATLSSFAAGGYVISGKGGFDVGAFNTTLNVPQPLTWTNKDAITTTPTRLTGTVNRTQPLKITWSGGDPNGFAVIAGYSISGLSDSALGGYFACVAPVSDNQFTVPPSAMLAMPATPANGIGVLLVGSSTAPQVFQATGLDFAFAAATSISGAQVIYQ